MEAVDKSSSDYNIDESKPLPVLEYVLELVSKAKQAARRLASLPTVTKDQALLAADELMKAHDATFRKLAK